MKPLSYLSPKAAVKTSPIHGNGLFAKEPILAGEIVCVKGGHIFLRDNLQEVSAQLGPAEIQIGKNLFIGPLSQEEREGGMIFSNHSCDPNIGVKGQIVFVAMRDIKAGEELTHDWAMTDNDTYEMQCHCSASNCRKVITGQDWRKPDLQERYRGFMSWYLTEQSRNEIVTKRLLLRQWTSTDREPFAALSADPRVMKYFPAVLSREESDAVVDRIEAHWARHGFGFWVAEIPNVDPFIGCVGLLVPRFEAHFTPCVEIGWRIAAQYWNQGYATEAARAVLHFGFERLNLSEIVALTVPANAASRRVMEHIGMTHDPSDDFDHPLLPAGHPLNRHVLYRVHRK